MTKNNLLISTAVLTSIWDTTRKDNIELIKPFVCNILYKKYNVGDKLDVSKIADEMKKQYYFNNFPIKVLLVVFKRLKKNGIIKALDNEYYLDKKDEKCLQDFDEKLKSVKTDVLNVENNLKDYLKDELNKKNITDKEVEEYLYSFIYNYGFDTYINVENVYSIDKKKDEHNYIIGMYIRKIYKENEQIFNSFLRIIEGHMIANAIYMQIDNDNKANLSNLDCYLDSPFILRVLGFKTEEENRSANELYNLLLKYRANLYCFKHTYDEVYSIITYYKANINKSRINTLEGFDQKHASEGEIDIVLSQLENTFKNKKIRVVEKPELNEKNQKYNINCKLLEEKIRKNKELRKIPINDDAIMNDVNTITSINILRAGKTTSRIENCKAIFITTYHYLKQATKEVMPELKDTDINLVIDDMDLTTLLWFKDYDNQADLPKIRLIENAIAATSASEEVMRKTIDIYEKMDKSSLPELSDVMTKHYIENSGFIDEIKNNPNKVSEKSFIDFIQDKDKKIENLEKKNAELNSIINSEKDSFIEYIENTTAAKFATIRKVSQVIYTIIVLFISILLAYFQIDWQINIIAKIAIIIYVILSTVDTITPKFKFGWKLIDRVITKIEGNVIYKRINNYEQSKKTTK